jgi:SAM-dependent methyltransferase
VAAAALDRWLASLETRYFRELTFPEISRALRALSSLYVERRDRLSEGAALSGAGKRAAFALFYGPLHFLLVERILPQLEGAVNAASRSLLVDLGCGTGSAGAAWAVAAGAREVVGIDRSPWALVEARQTYRALAVNGRTRQADITHAALPNRPAALLAAYTMNELPEIQRERLIERLVEHTTLRGGCLLVVEPIARGAAPWWRASQRQIETAGGRADEWRFEVELPPLVAKLDRAAGLNHDQLTGRTLWLSRPAAGRAASS